MKKGFLILAMILLLVSFAGADAKVLIDFSLLAADTADANGNMTQNQQMIQMIMQMCPPQPNAHAVGRQNRARIRAVQRLLVRTNMNCQTLRFWNGLRLAEML